MQDNSTQALDAVFRKLQAGGIGIWTFTAEDGKDVIWLDDVLLNMIGLPGAAPAMPWEEFVRDVVHPDDKDRVRLAMARAGRTGDAVNGAVECRLRDCAGGAWLWVYSFGSLDERSEDGSRLRISGGALKMQSKMDALHSVRQKMLSVLASTGQTGMKEADPPAKESGALAEDISAAFDLITAKMWWYKAVIDSIPFPVFVTDMEKRWTYLNTPALESIGASCLAEVQGSPAQPWGVDQGEAQAAQPEDEVRGICRHQPEQKRFFQGQASYLYDQLGSRIGHIEAVQDITEIHEADERTRIMLDAMPLSCLFWDAHSRCFDCNLAAPKLFRLSSKQELLSRFDELHPDVQPDGRPSREAIEEDLRRALEEGFGRFEWMHKLPDGALMPAEVTLVRVEYGQGHVVLGYASDLTELKKKEQALDKERKLLVKIMDSSPVCFVILVDGVIRFATPHALEFFGARIGDPFIHCYPDAAECDAFLREVERNETLNWRIVPMLNAGGEAREMLANAFLAEYYDMPCVMSWFLDVTEMRETERHLRLARDAAEESTRAKGDFLANMSHEIRTPMNAILGMTRLVLGTGLDERQRWHLEKVEQSATALLRILNDILDFSKIEAGRLEMEVTNFHLRELLGSLEDMFRAPAAAAGLELRVEASPDVPRFLRGDPLRLHQILINLVNNAVKFTRQGGVYVRVSVSHADESGVFLRFSVRDTGIGLDPGQREKLFSAFSQADTSMTRRYGGTGLGLAISKRLVEMMRGEITCVSEPGQGAEFFFTAFFEGPGQEAEQAEEPAGAGRPGGTGKAEKAGEAGVEPSLDEKIARLKGRRILVAEDNEINQIVVREMLEQAGFVVEIASNGKEAIEMALANRYDLIFMDIQMPHMDGLTATKTLRRHEHLRTVPVVAMTAHAMVGDREKSLSAGMNAHVTKPIDNDEVFTVIADWMTDPLAPEARQAASAAAFVDNQMQPCAQESAVTELPSSLPGIDVASGLARVAGNQKLYLKLLRHVASDAPESIRKLTDAIGEGDTQTVRELAHSLKGSSSNLSLTAVAAAAEQLELTAKAGDFAGLFVHVDALETALTEYAAVVETLKDL